MKKIKELFRHKTNLTAFVIVLLVAVLSLSTLVSEVIFFMVAAFNLTVSVVFIIIMTHECSQMSRLSVLLKEAEQLRDESAVVLADTRKLYVAANEIINGKY